jgi:predicted RNase H-like HicB family nuclease
MSDNIFEKLKVVIGSTGDGKFVAASTQSPYFCFEGPTEEAVLDTVKRALAFYAKTTAERIAFKGNSSTTSVTTIRAPRVLQLEVA